MRCCFFVVFFFKFLVIKYTFGKVLKRCVTCSNDVTCIKVVALKSSKIGSIFQRALQTKP